ncbi:MAG TPA: ABC transporter permease [Candidatus Acidoferrales bacterium]|nr:ABC transporter permease [Candidatus Acidoferrales bacterium]
MTGVRVITELTLREAARKKVLWLALVGGGAFLALFGTGLHFQMQDAVRELPAVMRRPAANVFLVVGLYGADMLTVILTVLVAADTLSGEIVSGTIQAVATKPIDRWEMVAGKWLGCAVVATAYLALMVGGTAALGRWVAGARVEHLAAGVGLVWLESALVLTLTILGGTTLSALASAVLVLGLHGLAFLGGWIEQFGAMMHSQRAVMLGIVASVVMPSESLWRRAAYEMQTPLAPALGLGPMVNLAASVPSAAMVVYAAVYMAAAFAVALLLFQRRDL